MSPMDIQQVFDAHHDEFLQFDRVKDRFNQRPDLHAFILLDRLVPGDRDMVAGAEHDEIYLEVSPDELAAVATVEQVVDLIRCGVRLSDYALRMFA